MYHKKKKKMWKGTIVRAIQQARMRLEKNSQTKLRSHSNTLAGICATSFQEQLSFSALAQESAISSGLGFHFSGYDWSGLLGARRNRIYSYASLAIRITTYCFTRFTSPAFLIKRSTQLERVNRFRYQFL